MISVSKTDSTNAERSLIGASLLSNRVVDVCAEFLKPTDFSVDGFAQLWQTMLEVRAEGKPTKYGQLVASGADRAPLDTCVDVVGSHIGFESYAKQIKLAAERRAVVQACISISHYCSEAPEGEAFKSEVLDILLGSFANSGLSRDTYTIDESAEAALRAAVAALERGGDVSGLSVGYPSIDQRTTGLHAGELVILAARPGMGKTTLALNIARAVAGFGQVAFFSMEMPHEQLGGKILSTEAGIGSQDLRTGRIGNAVQALTDACVKMRQLGLTIFDNSAATLGYLRSKLHQLEARTGKKTDLILLDYLQLMGGDSRSDNRVQEVSKLSRGLKILARDFKCPVIALSQLNRSVEQRTDKRPLLSDLRESGSIEQDADMVWFLYREDYYSDTAAKGVSELIIAKQRNGPLCTVPLSFDGRLSRFDERIEREEFRNWDFTRGT